MSRIAFFKNVNQALVDSSQNDLLNTLIGQISTKATQADLVSGLAQKADSSSVTYALSTKADTSYVSSSVSNLNGSIQQLGSTLNGNLASISNNLNSQISLKADSSAVISADDALTAMVNTKLAKSVYDARIVSEAVFYDSVSNSIVFNDANGVEINYVALGLLHA